MSAWDNEYFDYIGALIEADCERRWQEAQLEQMALRCMTERDGWVCELLKHDDERHVFVRGRQRMFVYA
jgi:hypothetical protein